MYIYIYVYIYIHIYIEREKDLLITQPWQGWGADPARVLTGEMNYDRFTVALLSLVCTPHVATLLTFPPGCSRGGARTPKGC